MSWGIQVEYGYQKITYILCSGKKNESRSYIRRRLAIFLFFLFLRDLGRFLERGDLNMKISSRCLWTLYLFCDRCSITLMKHLLV